MIEAVLFDVDDTLYDQTMPFSTAYDAVFSDRGWHVSMNELYTRSRVRSDEVFGPSQRGEISMETMYIYRIQKAFEDIGISITDVEALSFQSVYAMAQQQIYMTPVIESLLGALVKMNVQLGIITNGPSDHQRNKIERLGLRRFIPEKHIIISGDIGVAKPDAAIFAYAAQRMNLVNPPLFVGDSIENDIKGAKKAGWYTLWFNRRGLPLPEIQPNYYVDSEELLKSLLLDRIFIRQESGQSL